MRSLGVWDKSYNISIKRMVKTVQAPHYTEIAAKLGVPVEDGRKALHDLVALEIPDIWLFPETDYIGSFHFFCCYNFGFNKKGGDCELFGKGV